MPQYSHLLLKYNMDFYSPALAVHVGMFPFTHKIGDIHNKQEETRFFIKICGWFSRLFV